MTETEWETLNKTNTERLQRLADRDEFGNVSHCLRKLIRDAARRESK